jgi:hypothetical protein
VKVKVEPLPTSLFTQILPPCIGTDKVLRKLATRAMPVSWYSASSSTSGITTALLVCIARAVALVRPGRLGKLRLTASELSGSAPATEARWMSWPSKGMDGVYEEGGVAKLATIKPTAMLELYSTPGLSGVAREVEATIEAIMAEAAG